MTGIPTCWISTRLPLVSCLLLGTAALVVATGCVEHRIGLEEFLEREHAARNAESADLAQAPPVNLDSRLGPERLGVGDVIDISLTGSDGAPIFPQIRTRVGRDGRVGVPVVGQVDVGDRELVDAEARILDAFVPDIYKEAACHVALVSTSGTDVLVIGAVAMPGLVSLHRNQRNLLYAVAGAGGISQLSSGEVTLQRIRQPDTVLTFNLTNPIELRNALALDPLEPGDIIHAHAAEPNTIFVGGLVARAGPQSYPTDTNVSVLQALAAASGLRTDVAPKEGTLVRRMPDGSDVHVLLDLDRIATGDAPNLTLAAGDILWVPETFETRVHDFLNRNLFLRAGVSVNYNVTGVEFLNRRSMQTQRGGGGSLQDSFDPFGFLGQNSLLQTISTTAAAGG